VTGKADIYLLTLDNPYAQELEDWPQINDQNYVRKSDPALASEVIRIQQKDIKDWCFKSDGVEECALIFGVFGKSGSGYAHSQSRHDTSKFNFVVY